MCDRAAWSSSKLEAFVDRDPSRSVFRHCLHHVTDHARPLRRRTSSSESAAIFMHPGVTVNISGLATAMHSLTSMSPDWSACILCYAARRSDGAAERLGL